MGTRSLLGYELPNGKIYAQYQQYDGCPDSKGREYYVGVLRGLKGFGRTVGIKKPTTVVFKRIRSYLNELQYVTGHSINNHLTATKADWYDVKLDCDQEWQYLFKRNGDFVFFAARTEAPHVVIPWALTVKVLSEYKVMDFLENDKTWWEATELSEYEENTTILAWGKKGAALHVGDELNFESSRVIRDKLLKGEQVLEPTRPVFSLEYGESLAFPSQGNDGWRDYSLVKIGTTLKATAIKTSLCSERTLKRRNIGKIEALYLFGKERNKE